MKLVIAIFLLLLATSLAAVEPLNIFGASRPNELFEKRLKVGAIDGKAKYNLNIKDVITDQSVLTLGLDFLNERIKFDVISLSKTNSNVSFSAIASDGADILTISESSGVMLGSLTHNNKLYKPYSCIKNQ